MGAGFVILISLGLATNIFLTLAVQHTLVEAQHVEETAVEARAATRSLRADYLEMESIVGAALLNPALQSKFSVFWQRKQTSDANAAKHLQKASDHASRADLKLLLKQLKARDATITNPLELQLLTLGKIDIAKARQLYITRYLPAQHENIRLSQTALTIATQHVIDLNEDIVSRAAVAQMVARRAILLFVLIGIGSGFFLTRSVAAIAQQAEQSAQANRNMLEYSQDVICSIDEAGRFIDVNPACLKVWGYTPEELKGFAFEKLIHPDDIERTNETARSIISGVAVKDFENRYLCKDGSVVDMLWSAHWSGIEKSMFCVARDVTERKAVQEKLRTQAMFDSLTGQMNRAAVIACLAQEIERSARELQPLSIVLIDLDHFKQVNDTHGHAAGDAVLKETAQRMKNSMRGYDKVGRYGGEEFLIVAPGCSSENVLTLAERVRHAIGNAPIDIGEKTLQMSCSLGAAVMPTVAKEGIDAFIARADEALYCAKANGRNRSELAPQTVALSE